MPSNGFEPSDDVTPNLFGFEPLRVFSPTRESLGNVGNVGKMVGTLKKKIQGWSGWGDQEQQTENIVSSDLAVGRAKKSHGTVERSLSDFPPVWFWRYSRLGQLPAAQHIEPDGIGASQQLVLIWYLGAACGLLQVMS